MGCSVDSDQLDLVWAELRRQVDCGGGVHGAVRCCEGSHLATSTLRELIQKGLIVLKYCPTANMTADILTKALGTNLFEQHRKNLEMKKN